MDARCTMADALTAPSRDAERAAALDTNNQEEWERHKDDLHAALTESQRAQNSRTAHATTHRPT
jgi:hypothetical protein